MTTPQRPAVRDLAERMAADLRNVKVDLNNEIAVYWALQGLRYTAKEILAAGDLAVSLAKPSAKNLLSVVGEFAAFACAIAVWVAWYCVLCPPVAS